MIRLLTIGILLAIASSAFAEEARPRVGAIRWDAWTGGNATKQVERTLGPKKYHNRLPWFAEIVDASTVRIDGSRQAVMDREIELAARAGLDYWAFVTYPAGNPLSVGLDQYLHSPNRDQIRFCLILHNTLRLPEDRWPAERDRAVALLQEPGYQTVLGGRPLLFVFTGHPFPLDRFHEFVSAAREKGLHPYCVYMGWNPASDFKKLESKGFDAVSAYAKPGEQPTYVGLTKAVEKDYWLNAAESGARCIPLVTTGWDKRPRKDHPVSWEKGHSYHQQEVFPSRATPAEIAQHLRKALAFVRDHPKICPADAVLIYAWNEYDEGGWIGPTRGADGKPDTSRLDAIRAVLRGQGSPPSTTIGGKTMKELRRAAASRRRRLIVNNDGGEPIRQMKRSSAKDMLDVRMTPLAGTDVDSLFYSTGPSGMGVFSHFTKIGQVFTSQEGSYRDNKLPALLAKGIDPLRVNRQFAKNNHMEFFWSMRMNDTHDGGKAEYSPIRLRFNKLKQEHPEYLIGSAERRPKHGAWTAVNYAVPAVRDRVFRYIEEVCRDYDVDGIELDFFRHPVFFKSTGRGEPATDEERAAMTGLLKRIRAMADAIGRRRGRPILIAARVPDSVEYCRAIGLELDKWLARDLLDLLAVSSYFKLNDWDYSVALARRYGVPVYCSLDESRVRDKDARAMRRTALAYRGRAANVWAYGADGVYVFNFPRSVSSLTRELGDPRVLAKLDKDYFGSVRGRMSAAGGNLPYDKYQTVETLNPSDPKVIAPGKSGEARINVGEDWTQTGEVTLKLRLQFKTPLRPELVDVSCNGQPLRLLGDKGRWLEYAISPSVVRQRSNLVRVKLAKNAPRATWTDLMLQVRHPTESKHP